MDADYSIELGPTAAALELPWQDPAGRLHYIDLRAGQTETVAAGVARIPEATEFPALADFLVQLNSPPSVWQTAKCDVWSGDCDAVENLYGAAYEHACYVDIVFAAESAERLGLELHEQIARTLSGMLDEIELEASAEITVRRCYFHRRGASDDWADESGYALTFFLTGYGESPEAATACWAQALELSASCWIQLGREVKQAKARELG